MTLTNTSLVPEFQHYFRKFVIGSTINKNQVPFPVDVNLIFLTGGSVVELLCRDTFPYNNYTYLYSEESIGSWPELTRQRLMIYPSSKYLVPGTEGDNIFGLQSDDLLMLDVLLMYRHDSTSVTLIDTTADSIIVTIDSTAETAVVVGNIDNLSTSLSKLIFLYLDLHINGNYLGYYNIPIIISDCSMLATCFELKLIDDYFDLMNARADTFSIYCEEE